MCSLGKLRPFLSARVANAIAAFMVLSRLDHSNNCLWGVPSKQLKRLQLVQNTAARIVIHTWKREDITPVLKELHWLPVRKQINHNSMSSAYKCYEGRALEYQKAALFQSFGMPYHKQSGKQIPLRRSADV